MKSISLVDGVEFISLDGGSFYSRDIRALLSNMDYEIELFSPSLIIFIKRISLDSVVEPLEYNVCAVKVNFLMSVSSCDEVFERILKVGSDFVLLGCNKDYLLNLIRNACL